MVAKPKRTRGCSSMIMDIMNKGDSLKDSTSDIVQDGFEDAVDFEWVYKNMDYDKKYKTWIMEGNSDDKTLGYKKMLSYPYQTLQFGIGDYIHFNYLHIRDIPQKWTTWLLISLDTLRLFNVNGRIVPCNQTLNMSTSKGVVSYPCNFEDTMKYTTLDMGQHGFVEPNCDIVVYVQNNKDTKNVYINQRFLFNGRAYIVIQYNNSINNGLLKLFMNKVSEQPEDDLEKDVAWNGNNYTPTYINGINITPSDVTSLKQGESQEYEVRYYSNEKPNDDAFEITSMGVPQQYYSIENVGNNKFTIKCNKQYRANSLTIKLKDIENQEVKDLEIWLRGVV